jgi:hypothetical protein
MPSIYLSGPITGHPDFKERFGSVAAALRRAGWIVLNPAETPAGLSEFSYMDIACAQVRSADAILMLDGWRYSTGAQCEHALAAKCEKVIYTESQLPELLAAKPEATPHD